MRLRHPPPSTLLAHRFAEDRLIQGPELRTNDTRTTKQHRHPRRALIHMKMILTLLHANRNSELYLTTDRKKARHRSDGLNGVVDRPRVMPAPRTGSDLCCQSRLTGIRLSKSKSLGRAESARRNLWAADEPKIGHCTGETENRANSVQSSPANQQCTGLEARKVTLRRKQPVIGRHDEHESKRHNCAN
jgi:hypothetical protein